jgi:hypothetical protein
MAGHFPVDHRTTFTSNRTHEEIRATMMDRDYSRAHLTQAALAVFGGFPPFFQPSRCDPKRVVFDPIRVSAKKWQKSAVSAGIGWDHISPVFDSQTVAIPRVTALL